VNQELATRRQGALLAKERVVGLTLDERAELSELTRIVKPKCTSYTPEPDFYKSDAWRTVRYKALKKANGKCQCCGEGGKRLHVDHIKPRSKFPHLELDENNLQVLCEDCNLGKGAWDQTDWRR
jgi:5-methylcytosine-specific restriction endonuclease McrA